MVIYVQKSQKMNTIYKQWPTHYRYTSGIRHNNTSEICSRSVLSASLWVCYIHDHNTMFHSYLPLNLSYCKVFQRSLVNLLPDSDHNNSEIVRRKEDLFFWCTSWSSCNVFSLYSVRPPELIEYIVYRTIF
jgi:hypothetical protein